MPLNRPERASTAACTRAGRSRGALRHRRREPAQPSAQGAGAAGVAAHTFRRSRWQSPRPGTATRRAVMGGGAMHTRPCTFRVENHGGNIQRGASMALRPAAGAAWKCSGMKRSRSGMPNGTYDSTISACVPSLGRGATIQTRVTQYISYGAPQTKQPKRRVSRPKLEWPRRPRLAGAGRCTARS